MKASDAVAHVLGKNNITHGFELIGGMIAHLVDSINQLGKTKLVSLHHEQAAAFAAGGIARASNNEKIGLALGTSGPGATNLITGIADCWLDSYPCIFITGQVNTNELKGSRNIRQQGFQELDIVSLVGSITKYAYQIKTKDELIVELQKAIDIAKSGRPGPVLIDIPMDLQRAELENEVVGYLDYNEFNKAINNDESDITNSDFEIILEELDKAKKPLFLIGGGATASKALKKWQACISDQRIPHVASLKGCEKVASLNQYFGLIGSYGTRTANYAVQNCDLLVVVGSRMDVRQTGSDTDDFARKAKIIQIDLEEAQLENRVKADINILANTNDFFEFYLRKSKNKYEKANEWNKELDLHWNENFVDEYHEVKISPFNIFSVLNKKLSKLPIQYVADVGNNQMWAAHSIRLSEGQAQHHSGGLGAMGFAIPTAIGVHYANQEPTVVLTGDGGVQLNIQELDIIARENLPILTIVFNNESLGMVRAFQEMYFDGRNESTYWQGYSSKFQNLGAAYGIDSNAVNDLDEFNQLITEFANNPKPMLIEIIMSDARECRPRLSFGNPIDKQFPLKD